MGPGRWLPESSCLSPGGLGYVLPGSSAVLSGSRLLSEILLVLSVAMSHLCPFLPAGPRTSVTQPLMWMEGRGGGAAFLVGDSCCPLGEC